MNWFNIDGEQLAEIIYSKLLESENGELSFNEIMNIYEDFEHPIFRKTEGACWNIVYTKGVERVYDENKKYSIKGVRLIKDRDDMSAK